MKKIKIDWFTRLVLKFWPSLAMVRLAKKMGITNPLFNEAHNLFSKIRRIDLLPLKFGYRGFIIVLDKKTALYFHQNYDHFVYDGFEMGKYEKGDVTIFDDLRREKQN